MLEIYRAFEQLAPCDCGNSQRAVTVEDSFSSQLKNGYTG